MKLHPKVAGIVQKEWSFDDDRAGWYVHNSVYYRDIVPSWRLPGGGVSEDNMTRDLKKAFDIAAAYTRIHIAEAEKHLNKLIAARAALQEANEDD